ncbi:MAG: hypothetical protein M3Q05_02975, partial [Bacteroidota bacterium]|nr:hypothetical protein [Bacteroidota bacterium]
RILPIQVNNKGEETVRFDIVLKKEFKPSDAFFAKICGIYRMSDNHYFEVYREGDLLFTKFEGLINGGWTYKGNNEFIEPFSGEATRFEIQENGGVKICLLSKDNQKCEFTGIKTFKY